jgi:ubiquinone/menaquinone biosynthesis C-methylase UbiE
MRALAHVNAPQPPDYALRVPRPLQLLIACGLVAGCLGLALLLGVPTLSPAYAVILLVLGAVSAALAAALWMITARQLRERMRRRMLDSVAWRGDERVLDVGCGNGFLLVEIAKRLTTGRATGIDLWKAEAGAHTSEVAWRNAHTERVADRIEIRNVDARTMPFEDQSFDVIVSSLMLHHAGGSLDRDQVIREMLRVLKPGGTLMLYDARPIIAAATRQLRQSGLASIRRTGQIMVLLIANRPATTADQLAS